MLDKLAHILKKTQKILKKTQKNTKIEQNFKKLKFFFTLRQSKKSIKWWFGGRKVLKSTQEKNLDQKKFSIFGRKKIFFFKNFGQNFSKKNFFFDQNSKIFFGPNFFPGSIWALYGLQIIILWFFLLSDSQKIHKMTIWRP